MGAAFDDKRSMVIYEARAELKSPLLFPIDNLRNLDKAGRWTLGRSASYFAALR